MNNFTPFERRIFEHVKQRQTVAPTEDLFDFENFDKLEYSMVGRTLESLVAKSFINHGRKRGNYAVFPR